MNDLKTGDYLMIFVAAICFGLILLAYQSMRLKNECLLSCRESLAKIQVSEATYAECNNACRR